MFIIYFVKIGLIIKSPIPKLLWPHVENILFYYHEIINGIFALPGRAVY